MLSDSALRRTGVFRFLSASLAVVLAANTLGCSFFVSRTQPLSVSSEPSGARVQINGMNVGTTPLQYRIARKEPASVLVTKEGFETQMRNTGTHISGWGILDIVGGCIWLVPFFGLLAQGAWSQEPLNIAVAMPEKK
ncbi:MAG: PEGA domain protein [candidate division BRC1 bacterium ADurb.BinA364]|nr:MAG: PEGA domain protein [candidate division BRC1 bacterium ADurb.BinA364]